MAFRLPVLLGPESPTATSALGSSTVTVMELALVFGTESDDSAVNMEDTEPVLLRRARLFDGVLGRLMMKNPSGDFR